MRLSGLTAHQVQHYALIGVIRTLILPGFPVKYSPDDAAALCKGNAAPRTSTSEPAHVRSETISGEFILRTKTTQPIERALTINDWIEALNASRSSVERMRASGNLPKPDFYVGKCPRWKRATVLRWIDSGGAA
jgi:hypothetical protein